MISTLKNQTRTDWIRFERRIASFQDRLGEPDFHVINESRGVPPDQMIGWTSEECDAAVLLESEYFYAVDTLAVRTYLMRGSKLPGVPLWDIPDLLDD